MAKGKKAAAAATESLPLVSFSLNKPARDIFGDAEFARVRVSGDEILVLPSKRTKGLANLPKPDVMVTLVRTSTTVKMALPLEGEVPPGAMFLIEEMNYGWTKFVPISDTPAKDAAVAKVIVR